MRCIENGNNYKKVSSLTSLISLFCIVKMQFCRELCSNGISNAAGRRIANNIFSLSSELGLLRLLRPGTERIKLYSQCNQLCTEKGIIEKIGCERKRLCCIQVAELLPQPGLDLFQLPLVHRQIYLRNFSSFLHSHLLFEFLTHSIEYIY